MCIRDRYTAKEISVEMSSPTRGGMKKIKRAIRYLVGAPRLIWKMKIWSVEEVPNINVVVDSDWAKAAHRKSTSGGMMTFGGSVIKHWSRTQKSRALSSGEAEYYAVVGGCAEALGVQSILQDLGWPDVCVQVGSDSSTAISVSGRRGLGKLRHNELKYLWVQEVVNAKRVRI